MRQTCFEAYSTSQGNFGMDSDMGVCLFVTPNKLRARVCVCVGSFVSS